VVTAFPAVKKALSSAILVSVAILGQYDKRQHDSIFQRKFETTAVLSETESATFAPP